MNPNQLFADAKARLDRGDASGALAVLDPLTAAVGPHPAILHLAAMAQRTLGDLTAAEGSFRQAMALPGHPRDPVLLTNAASLFEAVGKTDEALALLDEAAGLAPQAEDIQLARLAAIRRHRGDDAAEAAWQVSLRTQPQSASLHHHHALFLRDASRSRDALAAIDRALELAPGSANARQLKARLLLDLGEPATGEFLALRDSTADRGDVAKGLAASLAAEGRVDEALAGLDAFLSEHPERIDVARTRYSMAAQFYDAATAERALAGLAAAKPTVPDLALLLVGMVWRARGAGEASAALDAAALDEALPAVRFQRAEMASELGDLARADTIFEALEPHFATAPPAVAMAQVRHHFRAGRIELAASLAHRLARESGLMEAWAHVETGWRLLEDPRWAWLTGDGGLAQAWPLSTFTDYRADLIALLRQLHAPIRNHPVEQSPRGGTQTDGVLLSRDDPALRAYRDDVRTCVSNYLAGLPELGDEHPLTLARQRHLRFAGSWSIRLTGEGYHTAHFHNEGVISSASYIVLPDEVARGGGEKRGWIEFGRPAANLGLDVAPFAAIQPEVGSLALFPSFFWHGTRPFGQGERMTIAFDIAPVA